MVATVESAHDVGDRLRLGNPAEDTTSAAFTDSAGVATDPTVATLRLQAPDGTVTVYRWPTPGAGELSLTKESAGRFYADVTPDQAGTWAVELRGTGVVEAADSWLLFVRPAVVG